MKYAEVERLNKRNQYHRDTLKSKRNTRPASWKEIHEEIIEYSNLLGLEEVRVLDAGAGEGRYREILSPIRGLEYIGVDSGVGSDEWDFSQVIKSDLSSMDFIEDHSVDIVVMVQVLSHVKNLEDSIKEISKKMKSGAVAFITTQNMQSLTHIPYDFVRFTPYGLEEYFRRYGLNIQEIRPLLYGDNISASNQLVYAMQQNILNCPRCSRLNIFFSKIVMNSIRVLNKLILERMDRERDFFVNPQGYFAKFKKGESNGRW